MLLTFPSGSVTLTVRVSTVLPLVFRKVNSISVSRLPKACRVRSALLPVAVSGSGSVSCHQGFP